MNTFLFIIIGLIVIFAFYKLFKLYKEAKNVEKEFISIVNHAFRTPLTRISWISRELEKTLNANDERLYQLQGIDNAVDKIISMVDSIVGIRDLAKTSGYDFKVVSIREIIENAISKYREIINKKGINFRISPMKNIPSMTVDLKKISFVIEEIIENAINYSQNGGNIFIDVYYNNKSLSIEVSDEGIGLTTIDKIRIFTKFYRNKKAKLMNTDGIGLSLFLCKQIIRKHKGKIYASSKGVDKGTSIVIILPL